MFEEISKDYLQRYNLTVRLTRVKVALAMVMMIKGIYGTPMFKYSARCNKFWVLVGCYITFDV